MMLVRKAGERGHTDAGWLDSRHTFSFGEYHDAAAMGFRVLRVLNDDRVAPGGGFPTHGHRDMEIVSYVLEGGLEHRDSLGTGSVIRPGDVQRMSAGTGVRHSEFNASQSESVHFLQIWILPERAGLAPGYEQKHVPDADKRGQFRLIASHDGRDGSVTIHQDTAIYASLLQSGQRVRQELLPGRHAYLHVARGEITVGDQDLNDGDGAAFAEVPAIEVVGRGPAEVLLFDMP